MNLKCFYVHRIIKIVYSEETVHVFFFQKHDKKYIYYCKNMDEDFMLECDVLDSSLKILGPKSQTLLSSMLDPHKILLSPDGIHR